MNSSLRILAFSSSRVGGGAYLEKVAPVIHSFLGNAPLQIAFIPFASVDDYGAYGKNVEAGLAGLPYHLQVAYPHNAAAVIEQCDVIMIGGGNTFKLLYGLYEHEVIGLVEEKANAGMPYISWSAGSNLTGLTICTTNDMPILQPLNFDAFGFFPFQINPHYFNETRAGFHGETRDQRLAEFLQVHPDVPVVCLPEGTWLQADKGECKYDGGQPGVRMVNRNGSVVKEALRPGKVLSIC